MNKKEHTIIFMLNGAIEKRGLNKTTIAKILGISRVTLYQRLHDGKFSDVQMQILKERYL